MSSHRYGRVRAIACGAASCAGLLVVSQLAIGHPKAAKIDAPSRPAEQGCVWEKFSDRTLHLRAWVQRCDFGSRKIKFVPVDHSLAIRYSDSGGAPDPVIDVFDLLPSETPEQGIQRLFTARTDNKLAARCVLAPYRDGSKIPAGVKHYTFVPDSGYEKELEVKADPNEVPEPPCGDWGDAPDGIQYFEAQPASGVAKVLFVRVGQDEPLFDEATLRLRP